MEYIKPMFLLLFVLGIVAAVSSRHAAKHYPVEDAGNQDESSLVKKTLKQHSLGSSLTSAFDIGEEKNKRKVTSVSNMDDSAANIVFEVDNDSVFPWMEGTVYLLKGTRVMELPEIVPPGHLMEYQVQEVPDTGSAGVFTYYIPDLQKTLAFMFSHDIRDPVSGCCGKFDVKLYHGQINADKDLYLKMKNDHPWDGDGEPQDRYLGSSFEAEGVMTTMPPNVKIFIH